jgi:hypothetical protein
MGTLLIATSAAAVMILLKLRMFLFFLFGSVSPI